MPSSSEKSQGAPTQEIGFIEKYAPQYYFSLLFYAAYFIFDFYFVGKPVYMFVLILMIPFIGKFMPKDDQEFKNPKYHNKNIYHAFPLAANVICNLAFMAYLCIYFPYLNYTGL